MTATGAAFPIGIDFGGSGIKGAPVDLEKGEFAAERVRIDTPSPSTPEAVTQVFVELLTSFPDSMTTAGPWICCRPSSTTGASLTGRTTTETRAGT